MFLVRSRPVLKFRYLKLKDTAQEPLAHVMHYSGLAIATSHVSAFQYIQYQSCSRSEQRSFF